jgi:hypothetical protein
VLHKTVILLGLCLVTFAIRAQDSSLTFANDQYVRLSEDAKPGDLFVTYGLSGETDENFTKRFFIHAFRNSGNDVRKGVGELIKWIRQRDKTVRIRVLMKDHANDVIVSFLLSPGADETYKFNVLRYAAASDGRGLVAAQYVFRFGRGEVDPDEMKEISSKAIDGMASFDMGIVQAYSSILR